jgi:hypothetical protein
VRQAARRRNRRLLHPDRRIKRAQIVARHPYPAAICPFYRALKLAVSVQPVRAERFACWELRVVIKAVVVEVHSDVSDRLHHAKIRNLVEILRVHARACACVKRKSNTYAVAAVVS